MKDPNLVGFLARLNFQEELMCRNWEQAYLAKCISRGIKEANSQNTLAYMKDG